MFDFSELIVREGDNMQRLVEDRARSFYERFAKEPTTAFLNPDCYAALMREIVYAQLHSNPPFHSVGTTNVQLQTSVGIISFKVVRDVKSFLLVGEANTYADLEFSCGIPKECWADSYRKKIDEEFERIVLGD